MTKYVADMSKGLDQLTVLDHFAAAAITGFCANPSVDLRHTNHEHLSQAAYSVAERMVEMRRAMQGASELFRAGPDDKQESQDDDS